MALAPVDLLVIGGGITGAGVARDAALRGMSVALVEKEDFGSGTSSRSSKIVHGGVRYLEYLQFGMVRESARERRILCRIAPHLVHPLSFLYPVFDGESLLKIRAGLRLFDAFAGNAPDERSRRLSPAQTREWLPGLRDRLKGAVLYPEYITDDARLTLANIASAAEHGALVANHTRALSLMKEGGRVVGARVLAGVEAGVRSGAHPGTAASNLQPFEIRARVTLNATGPWVPELFAASGVEAPRRIIPSKGIHILIERNRLPLRAATFLRSSTGRRGLAMPRGPWVYVGTSDDVYHEDLDRPRARRDEIGELLEMLRDCFPEAALTPSDVKASWAGIRPLIYEEGKSTRDMSRHDEVWISPPGLVTVAGGKLTTYRAMGRRILEQVARAAAGAAAAGSGSSAGGAAATGAATAATDATERILLPGAPGEPIQLFRARIGEALRRAGVPEATRERMSFLYGTEAEQLLAWGREDPAWLLPLGEGVPAVRGEVRLGVEEGMALTLADMLDRRMALLLFAPDGGRAGASEAARIMGERLGWDDARRAGEVASYARLIAEHGPEGVDGNAAPDPVAPRRNPAAGLSPSD